MTEPRSLGEKKLATAYADCMGEMIERSASRLDERLKCYDPRVVVEELQNVAVRSHPVAEPELRVPCG